MKVLKTIGYIVAGVIVIILILAFSVSTNYTVERSIVINAPQAVVIDQAVKFNNYSKWNPWNEDPNMKQTVTGTDGSVGAKYAWDGNDNVGAGTMEVVSATENRVDIKLHFIKPFEGDAETAFNFEKADSGVKVSWVMNGHAMRPMNILSLFNVMEKMIGDKYQTGLNSLKSQTERYVSDHTKRGFLISETELSARTYYGVKSTVKMADIQKFFSKNMSVVFTAASKTGLTPTAPAGGLYFTWDEKNMKTEVLAGASFSSELKGFEAAQVGGKALMISYVGSYDKIGEAHMAMDDYLKANSIAQLSPVVEEYVVDPMKEKDPSKWVTNIYYLVK